MRALLRSPARTLRLTADAAELWLGASAAYLLVLLSAAGARRVADRSLRGSAPAGAEPAAAPPLVALVPAHDEELCVADAVAALARQTYPADRRETIVVADNCSDATAARAAAAGATVWERHDPELRGKGPALHWALERLWRERPHTGVVAIVDADCIASQNFMESVASALLRRADAAQVRYVASNAAAAPEAALRAAAFCLMNEVRPLGQSALGLSSGLRGTGMAFRAELLRAVPWESYSVTEDVEFHLRLLQAGRVVEFVGAAEVRSPMPTSARTARSQQLRWESGNAELARRVPNLLLEAGRRRDVQLAHAAIERLIPPQAMLAAGTCALSARGGRRGRMARAILAAQVVYVLGGLIVADAPAAVWWALPHAPALVFRRLRIIGALVTGRTSAEWVRTARESG
jgi:cellulose synthase/poly-beta-1,6-N-acetylglucosamine synthase-like glycosyltransferase